MKKIRQFICASTQEVIERLARDDQLNAKCKCGAMALKTLSAPRYFGNSATCTGRSPSLK